MALVGLGHSSLCSTLTYSDHFAFTDEAPDSFWPALFYRRPIEELFATRSPRFAHVANIVFRHEVVTHCVRKCWPYNRRWSGGGGAKAKLDCRHVDNRAA